MKPLPELMLIVSAITAGTQQGPWPSEVPPLDRSLIQRKWIKVPNGRHFDDGNLIVNIEGGTAWVGSIDRYWAALPPEKAVLPQEVVGQRSISTNIYYGARHPSFSRRYKVGRGSITGIMVRDCGSSSEASDALARAGEGAQGIVMRVRLQDFSIGDECQVINGHPREGVEFRIGRFMIRVLPSGPNAELADRIVRNLARAAAFRLYSSGVAGDPNTEVSLAGGHRLSALQIGPKKYVSLESIRPFVDSIVEAPAGTEPGRVLKRGSHRVEVRAYQTHVLVNGAQRESAAPIPYASDLWVPYDPVVKALGY